MTRDMTVVDVMIHGTDVHGEPVWLGQLIRLPARFHKVTAVSAHSPEHRVDLGRIDLTKQGGTEG